MLRDWKRGVKGKPAQLGAASTSEEPFCGLVMVTVAEARLALSASVTVTPASTTTAPPSSVKLVVPAVVVTTGASGTAATETVLLAAALLAVPSLATNEITRAVVPGLCEVLS